MLYFLICVNVILLGLFSCIFVKTYQLSGYNIKKFINCCACFRLAFGDKNKLVFTKRIIRFYIVLLLICAGLFFLPMKFLTSPFLVAFDCCVVFVLTPIWIVLSHYIVLPIEVAIKKIYIIKAKNKLAKKNVIKIAITGSFGKTSTKNILKHILEKEYKVCATPKNYNTEMGTTLTILKNLEDHDVFISEMGARHRRDIEKLTKIVRPNYGVITAIGDCHIESFKSIQNSEDSKFELAENISPSGVMFFGGDEGCKKLFKKYAGNKIVVCQENAFAYAENIVASKQGCEFTLVINGEKAQVKTKLLGRFNVENIVLASAVAYKIGVSLKDIQSAISSLISPAHRLEVIERQGCTIIDDSYNSNEIGFQEALNVLNMFEGRKIVITPGIVELGKKQSDANFKLGGKIADVCDFLIIMNAENKNDLLSGAIAHNFKRENIFFASTRAEQMDLVKMLTCQGAVILFENDLPDNYK